MDTNHKSRLFQKIAATVQLVRNMEISIHASHATFFMILSLFPALVLVLGMLRYTALRPEDLMDLAGQFLPEALAPYVWKLISSTFQHTSRLVVSISAITALWSAARGMHGLITGLNVVYGCQEHRGWLLTRLISAAYTFVFLLMILLTLVVHVFGNTLLQLLLPRFPVISRWMELIDLRFFILVFFQVLVFSVMFMFLPNKRTSFRHNLPGALFSTLGWLTASTVFSIYVRYFSSYATIYGSVYAVALAMLWLHVGICIIFYGAVLNRLLGENGN